MQVGELDRCERRGDALVVLLGGGPDGFPGANWCGPCHFAGYGPSRPWPSHGLRVHIPPQQTGVNSGVLE